MKTICQVMIGLILAGCATSSQDKLEANTTLDAFFTASERQALEKLTDYVFSEMAKGCTQTAIDCYQTYFEKFAALEANSDSIMLDIYQPAQVDLMNTLDSYLFHEIWSKCEGYKTQNHKRFTVETLCLNPQGRYAEFLQQVAKENPGFQSYVKALQTAGGITPSMTGFILKEYKNIDLSSKPERMIVAIHLLTLNYPDKIH